MNVVIVKSNSTIEIRNTEKPPVGPGDILVKMLDTNTESFGMVLLIACIIGAVASIVGVRMYILFKKN